jgi:hypothetical protein
MDTSLCVSENLSDRKFSVQQIIDTLPSRQKSRGEDGLLNYRRCRFVASLLKNKPPLVPISEQMPSAMLESCAAVAIASVEQVGYFHTDHLQQDKQPR